MTKNIDPELKSIGMYLSADGKGVFIIPEYQRAYSWTISQCDKLWEDIIDYIESQGEDRYFFGTIIVNMQNNDKNFVLIDGQQRTTTFILLLRAMMLRLKEAINKKTIDKNRESDKLEADEHLKNIVKILYRARIKEAFNIIENFEVDKNKLILINNSINEIHKSELKNILMNRTYEDIEASVYKYPRKKLDNKYTNYFKNFKNFYNKLGQLSISELNTFCLYILEHSEVIEIRSWNIEQAITMFNSLNSDGMPLSDADIISAKLFANVSEDDKEFSEKWELFNNMAQDLSNLRLSGKDDILMEYMHINRFYNGEVFSENNKVIVTTPGIRRYFTEENKQLLKKPYEFINDLIHIANIWDKVKDYNIIKVIDIFNQNYKKFLITYLFKYDLSEIDEQMVNNISNIILKLFTVLEIEDIGYSSSKFKSFLYGQSRNLVDKDTSIKTIREEFKNHINKEWTYDNIYKVIVEYTGNPLVVLNEYLYAAQSRRQFDIDEKYNIEHIIPQSGRNHQAIREDANIVDEEEFNYYVNKLGNKILLEDSINIKLSDDWFRTKLCEKGYKKSKYPMAQKISDNYELVDKKAWTKDDVEKSTQAIAERITSFIFS